ncbi:hypothetical protein [Brevundimonas nasdae]|uniref:Uncharacterized protein n=1 Tax=Brevundimonas nasdae TaxID=172043 RepID=A0ABX8TKA0_9CAUL|nr:hypothetical protein [Brevundimonas nasdae]QYC11434.1 hypothetical protein KWG56_05510 [Brevundimonas nasdae]QYC14222.1 hypothetical protein KWG63_00845 [Brevundimonas nasdae]
MSNLQIRRLDVHDADDSFALAQLSDPALTPDAWRSITAAAADQAGVIGAFSNRTVRAILQYSIVVNGGGERLFVIDGLAAFDLFDPTTTADALLAEARRQADISCSGLALSARLDGARINDVLRCAADTAVLHRVF